MKLPVKRFTAFRFPLTEHYTNLQQIGSVIVHIVQRIRCNISEGELLSYGQRLPWLVITDNLRSSAVHIRDPRPSLPISEQLSFRRCYFNIFPPAFSAYNSHKEIKKQNQYYTPFFQPTYLLFLLGARIRSRQNPYPVYLRR